MNSAELPLSFSPHRSEATTWDEVRRIYRRVCVLRANGKKDDAEELEHGALRAALATARLSTPDAADEALIFSEEADRVANAIVLAELLAPMLAERLTQPSPPLTPAPSPASLAAASTPAPIAAPAAPTTPQIADLIDGMLALDHSRAKRPRR